MLAELIQHGGLVNTGDSAERRAALRCRRFAQYVLARVLLERNAWTSALLRAVVDEAIFADVKEPSACAAVPFVRESSDNIALEGIEVGEREEPSTKTQDAFIDGLLLRLHRAELTRAIMQNAHGAVEA